MPEVTLTLPDAIRQASSDFAQGHNAEAERICRAILDVAPNHFDARHLLAAIQTRRGLHLEALANYELAIKLRPGHAAAHYNRGVSLQALKRFSEALASYDRALAVHPDYVLALNNRGIVLKEFARLDDLLECYDRAIALQPNNAEALNNRAATLIQMKRFDEALVDCDRALGLRPKYAEAFNNRANALRNLGRYDKSLASCERAIALRPSHPDAYVNRGIAFVEQKRFVEALASYAKAISLSPGNAEAHYSAAHCHLLTGDFERGWQENEWRWKTTQARNARQDFEQPQWSGREAIAGKTILLHAEQGLGDTIQFCRYVHLVKQRGARIILQVQPSLKRLLSGLTGADIVLSRGEPLPPFDLHCPLLSLPGAFGTRTATISPMQLPLSAPSQLMQVWELRLGPKTKPRIGIAWSGRSTHKHDHHRSIPLRTLLRLLEFPMQLVSLQKELRGDDQRVLGAEGSDIVHFGPSLTDFSETAALVSLMDLVISVDTSVAHLSAALDRPTWILLPFIPDWRWMLDREDTPWYGSARLFRQQNSGGWNHVVARIASALGEFSVASQATAPRAPAQFSVKRLSIG